MEFTGKVIAVLPLRGGVSHKGNKWATQSYVLDDEQQYAQRIVAEVFGEDKINEFAIKQGETIKVSFAGNAREFNGNWYNDLRVFAVERVAAQAKQQPQQQYRSRKDEPEAGMEGNDKLPF